MADKFSKSYGCPVCDETEFRTTPKSDERGKAYWLIECTTCGHQFKAWPIEVPEEKKLWLVRVTGQAGEQFHFVVNCTESTIGAEVEEFWSDLYGLPDTVDGWEYEEIDPNKDGFVCAIYD